MSTNNFKYENILVVIPDFTFDTEGYEMYVEDMQEQLQKIGFNSCNRYDNDINFSGQIIAEWSLEDKKGDLKTIEVVIRTGYYKGANIDYIIIDETGQTNKTFDKKFEAKCKSVEKVLEKYGGEEYKKVGQASNGEAFYKKLNK